MLRCRKTFDVGTAMGTAGDHVAPDSQTCDLTEAGKPSYTSSGFRCAVVIRNQHDGPDTIMNLGRNDLRRVSVSPPPYPPAPFPPILVSEGGQRRKPQQHRLKA